MEEIILDFQKLLATIKNPKNNFEHFKVIGVLIDNFENKNLETNKISTYILVLILKRELIETSILYDESTQNNAL
jgi:hypothetical protein